MKKTKYPAVYENVGKKDICYYIKFKKDGLNHSLAVGKKSEGMTPEKALVILQKRKSSEIQTQSTNNKQITLNSLSELYFKDKRRKAEAELNIDIKERHNKTVINIQREQSLYNSMLKPFRYANFSLMKINEKLVTEYLDERMKIYAQKYVANSVGLAKSIIKFGIEEKILPQFFVNPFKFSRKEDRERFKKPTRSTRLLYFNKAEAKMLLEHIKEHAPFQSYFIAFVSLATGARPNSILELKLEDIDLKRKILRIYDFKRKMYYNSPINETFERLLNTHLKDRLLKESKKQYLFYSTDPYKPLYCFPRPVIRAIDKLFNSKIPEGEEKYVIYSFRHSFANILLFEENVSLYNVSKLLNHSNTTTTANNYLKFNVENALESVTGYNDFLGNE